MTPKFIEGYNEQYLITRNARVFQLARYGLEEITSYRASTGLLEVVIDHVERSLQELMGITYFSTPFVSHIDGEKDNNNLYNLTPILSPDIEDEVISQIILGLSDSEISDFYNVDLESIEKIRKTLDI